MNPNFTIYDINYDDMPILQGTQKGMTRETPPDLPSLLLDKRIVFLGLPLVPQVTELVVSQFMWLNYLQNDKPAYVYINSIGNQLAEEKQVYASDHEGFAVVDVMNYIRPEVWTWVLAEASTSAALVAAAGKKGRRYGNPHCRVMTAPPRVNREVAKLPNIIKRANELKWANDTYMELLAQYTGRDFEAVRRDLDRNQFFDVHGAIEYGLLDAVAPLDKIRQMGSVSTTKVMLSQTQGYTGGRGGAREEAPTAADA